MLKTASAREGQSSSLRYFAADKRQQLLGDLRETFEDPVLYVQRILQHHTWDTQEQILRAVRDFPAVAVKACHASSKTFSAAELTLWWLARYQPSIVITTASTAKQVRLSLWGEIHKAMAQSKAAYPKANQTELRIGPDHYAIGFTTSADAQTGATRFQSFHGKRVLLIVDEAPGVDPRIYDAIKGIQAGGCVHVLMLGNPTISSGPFFDAFNIQRSRWKTFTIDAFDTPNLRGTTVEQLRAMPDEELDRSVFPDLVTRRWVRDMLDDYSEDHPFWEARVRGRFPSEDPYSLIPLAWVERMKNEEPPAASKSSSEIRAGLDVAGPGEAETVLAVCDERRLLLLKGWPQPDPRGEIVSALAPYKDRLALNVDSIGVGWGIYLHLRDTFGKDHVFPVNVGDAARDKKFVNAKAEHYWGLRLRVEAGDIYGIEDDKLIGQLTAIRYSQNARGQIEIESKEDLRKRGVKSPDRAEALMLANAISQRPSELFRLESVLRDGVFGVSDDVSLEQSSGWRMGR